MKQSWTTGLEDQTQKDEIATAYRSSLVLRRRLMELLEKEQQRSWSSSMDKEGYDCPNWAMKQADSRGYERALRHVISLISAEK